MIPTLIIAISTSVLIVLSILLFPHIKIKSVSIDTYWIVALIGGIILLAFSFAPIKEVWSQLTSGNAINPIKILLLFFSMTFISIFLDELGLFKYLAHVAASKAKGSQIGLFFTFYLLAATLTVFTSNDVVILTLTPFICFFCKRSNVNPIPYLIGEFMAANTWSMMLVIGNPTNIYLATSAGITFIEYLKVMAVPTLIGGTVEVSILYFLFRKKLSQPLEVSDEEYHLEHKCPVIVGVSILFVCLVFLVISSYINIEMWIIALVCASSLLLFMLVYCIFKRNDFVHLGRTMKRLPYQLIPFFISMFIIVVALNSQGITSRLADILGDKHSIWVYGYSSYIASNVINNIPMSILFTDLTSHLVGASYTQAVYASIIGSNIGAFLTPIGALAGIMFSNLVKQSKVKFTFLSFIKYGVIVSLPVITVTLGMTYLFLLF